MQNLYILWAISLTLPLSILIFILLKNKKQKTLIEELERKILEQNNLNTSLELELKHSTQNLQELKATLLSQKNELKEEYTQNLQNLQKQYTLNLTTLKEELSQNFTLQNKALLAQNQTQLNEDSKKLLNEIFSPLKEQIQSYNKRLIENEASVKTSIENMFKYSNAMSSNAEKLAQILKGDKKIRGNFGEIQLKSVLENSGLVYGEQYKLQESLNLEGSRYVPDAIIYLERDKSIIIDAKFSLPSDFSFEEIGTEVGEEIAKNLYSRIDELSKKPYDKLSSYDFVLLFIPYQNILDLALEARPSLYQYAYDKKVYLTTPHTLFMALKTIQITWINIKRNESIEEAFEEMEKIYDKFNGVLANLNDVERHFDRLGKAKDELKNKLYGQGGLLIKFKKLQELGVKGKKNLS